MFISDKNLQNDKIVHGFFGRKGGVSTGIYASLNCGPGTEDDLKNVQENRRIVCNALGVDPEALLCLYQVHSEKCIAVKTVWGAENRPEGDAMVTDTPGVALGILTADCAPVLFYGEKKNGTPVIGAAHAGWGGALKGVLENTIAQMQKTGALPQSLRAVIGPCIALESYEVSESFKPPFIKQDPGSERFFARTLKPGHLLFDLSGYIERRLMLAGIGRVACTGKDTCTDEADYFSFRRATHRHETDYGRQLSVIAIRQAML